MFIIVPLLELARSVDLFFTLGYEVSLNADTRNHCEYFVYFFDDSGAAHFFEIQYQNIRRAELRNQQKLIEQNEQLKARITPHFSLTYSILCNI